KKVTAGVLLQDGKIWLTQDEINLLPKGWQTLNPAVLAHKMIWKSQSVPRVAVDRVSSQSNIYHIGRTVFAEGCGLWFLADVEQESDRLEFLLEHLADQGIGGERTAGYGAFTWSEVAPPDLPTPDGSQRVLTLARYNPTPQELAAGVLGEEASYELVDVGGWLGTPTGRAQRRKRVRMIEAGSVLVANQPLTGRLVDVCPEYDQPGAPGHPVYRSGIALTVGVPGGI
ncbi:type III-A CRISPR-associated RAMP protein Csm4, partial [Chloroflexota bacterium]